MFEPQIHLVRLVMQETGTYNPQFARPYSIPSNGFALDALENRVAEATRVDPHAKINGSLIASLCPSLVMPSMETAQQVMIPNGWNEQRLRFLLEVHVRQSLGTEIYYFQGYTDHFGVSLNGKVDPNMPMYINSFVCIHRSEGLSAYGVRDVLAATGQVVNGRMMTQNHMAGVLYSMTPVDVMQGIQSQYLQSSYAAYDGATVLDDRVVRSGDIFQSKRANSLTSSYLSQAIEHWRQATLLADFGQGQEDIIGRAIQTSYEASLYENPFIRAISDIYGSGVMASFTTSDLERMDSTLGSRSSLVRLAPTERVTHAGLTDDNWGNRDLTTQMAVTLSNGIAALMSECMLVTAGIHTTTLTINGVPFTTVADDSITSMATIPLHHHLSVFVQRLETELLPEVTRGGMIPIDVTITADLNSEIHIQLSIDGAPPEHYITPSFCDALMAPVITTDFNTYTGMLAGIEDIMKRSVGTVQDMTPAGGGFVGGI